MTDHFATLGEPRRPWLDAEALKEKFHMLSATVHPDRVHGAGESTRQTAADHYTALNAAYQCLREPKTRLHHLILLERGKKPGDSNQIPDDLLRLFTLMGGLVRQADTLLAEKSRITSPVLRVQLIERALPCLGSMSQLQSSLRARRDELDSELRQLDAAWPTMPRGPAITEAQLQNAERLYHLYGFIDRWLAQLQERAFQLTL